MDEPEIIESLPIDKKIVYNRTPYIIVIIILGLLVVGFLTWALFAQSLVNSRAATIVENPYCLRVACFSGEQPEAFRIPIADDPQRFGYQTLNYCIANAPPSAFTVYLNDCEIENDPEGRRRLADFFAWYPQNYLPTCGNGWKDFNVTLAEEPIPGQTEVSPIVEDDQNIRNPNNRLTLNGLNDPALQAAYCCALKTEGFVEGLTGAAREGFNTVQSLYIGLTPCP